ncbi:sensor histidine kinase [Kitasatospora sp. NPDC057198]|uniref:sensor histidine kinase n=1 Tax=Kitasatospora sp. NPDC057198 TaxID=3346046 RepID=UPI0036264235
MNAPPAPLLRRLPPWAWVAVGWCAVVGVRAVQREDEFARLLRYHGNVEDAPLLITAVVTTLAALLVPRAPAGAVAVAVAGSVAALGTTVAAAPVVLFLFADVLVGVTAAARRRRTSLLAAALPVLAVAGYALRQTALGNPGQLSPALGLTAATAVGWLVGHTVRQQRRHDAELAGRATEQAVTAERLRIARELHDMVAHSMGVIAVQAAVAGRVIDTQPAEARTALGAIETTGRETLAGLRRMLGLLRAGDPEPAPPAPAALVSLADLDALAARAADAGVRVELRRLGPSGPLPAEVELAAFRIVQESVTNVARHAGTGRCTVTLDRRPGELALEIRDSGRGPAPGGTGWGIAGMRERAALLHGTLTAGPGPDGGFLVAATLPLPDGERP